MNIDHIAQAIEYDAGEPIEGLRESLAEMKAGKIARKYTLSSYYYKKRDNVCT